MTVTLTRGGQSITLESPVKDGDVEDMIIDDIWFTAAPVDPGTGQVLERNGANERQAGINYIRREVFKRLIDTIRHRHLDRARIATRNALPASDDFWTDVAEPS